MDKILNALKCPTCSKTLSVPVLLPCGHMICQIHTQVSDEKILCPECEIYHPNKVFTIAKAFESIIDSQLSSIDFGLKHKQSLNACNELKKQLDKNDWLLNDLNYHIYETIDEMKTKVFLKRECLKLRIDEISQKLVDYLEKYEERCKINLKEEENLESSELRKAIKQFREDNENLKMNLNEWLNALNELKIDEEKWAKIKKQSEGDLEEVCQKLKNFEKYLFMNEFENKKCQVEFFDKANIDPILSNKVKSSYYFFLF